MQNAYKNSIAGKGGSAVMISDAVLQVRKVMLVANAIVRIVMFVRMVAYALLIDGNVIMQ